MITNIIDYLDPFTIVSCSMLISKQFYRISHQEFQSLEISSHHDRVIHYQFIHKCSSFRTLTSLDLRNCSIEVEDFTKWVKSGNLKGLKCLVAPNDGQLVLEIGNIYNECMEELKKGSEVDYTLPNLKSIQVENVCRLDLISPVEYSEQMTKTPVGEIKSSRGELFGKKKALSTLVEGVCLPMAFPQLFTGSRRPPRQYLFFGPMNSGKTMILDALHESMPSNLIEPFSINYYDKERAIRILFSIARLFGKYVFSILTYHQNLFQEVETEGEFNRRALTELVIQLDTRPEENLIIIMSSNRPTTINTIIRRRLYPRIYIKLLTGDDLNMFVKYQLEGRFGSNSFTTSQIDQITKLCEGYSPFEIEQMVKSIRNENIKGTKLIDCFKEIIEKAPPLNTEQEIMEIESFAENFASEY
ncbi:predicted protein [Naegleria gruberi]|uniref:Predicted protein n=1 Tax=Naegleria gruberi TaxID=5762 RepID=D2VP54_NAEGR|nr:uncharacterized protein NAEGRDRAFT_51149 [Naegleria gruberi]EFC41299.1 predicted protein [Naegleria gruberi]|eukprot:XP_002674043.1 predicted protein [Naegleria gruberi strain NEG-M]